MIVLAGDPEEPPVRLVIEGLDEIGAAYAILKQDQVEAASLDIRIGGKAEGGAINGQLVTDDTAIDLHDIKGLYTRLLGSADGTVARRFNALLDILPGRVLNRPMAMASNASKPYQAMAARACGFAIPNTLVTSDPELARRFIAAAQNEGDAVIYKSTSGVRSIVEVVSVDDLSRLDAITSCPVQFQRRVEGSDIRVHVVGDAVFATRIQSQATDYRYAARQIGEPANLEAIKLDDETRLKVITLSRMLNLPLTGIDLREMPNGAFCCFEANPSPAFSYYEDATGQRIGLAIARHLAGMAP